MGFLPWSFGFAIILAILGWLQFRSTLDQVIVLHAAFATCEERAQEQAYFIEHDALRAYSAHCPEEEAPPAEDDEESKRPPRLSRLVHIGSLFSNASNAQKETQEKIFKNLLRILYGDRPLPGGGDIEHLFELVRARALEWEQKFPIKKARYLANIELEKEDSPFQQALFRVLKGGGLTPTDYVDSLLVYISTTNRSQCANVYLAPRPVLLALFEQDEIVDDIMEYRNELYRTIRKDKAADRNTMEAEFRQRFASNLPHEINPEFIDFHVSSTRPPCGENVRVRDEGNEENFADSKREETVR